MPQEAPVEVTRHVDARLLLSETCETSFPTRLHYDAMDPYAITATFFLGDDNEVEWVLARDLLGDGLHRRAGDGDVVVRPHTRTASAEVELVLSSPAGHARLTLPAEPLAAFLEASHDVVPPGAESDYLDLDTTIMRLLSTGGDPMSHPYVLPTPPRAGGSFPVRSIRRAMSTKRSSTPGEIEPMREHNDASRSRPSANTRGAREDAEAPLIAVTTSGSSVQIQVCGEVDVSNRAHLQTALSTVELDGVHTVRLDLQHLNFCDIGGCGDLIRFERDARRSGHHISIHGANPIVRSVLSLIAGEDKPTFA
jgi:anti-anti-sigma regulatory factor